MARISALGGMISTAKLQQAPKLVLGAIVLGLSLYFIAASAHFFAPSHDFGKYVDVKALLLLHISGGAVALLAGPLQFWEDLRIKRGSLHRRMGKVYVLAVAMSAPCAAYLSATTAYAVGRPYALSLQVWVSVWMLATWLAYRYARQKKFKLHKEWMVRSYLVTLAFVTSALLSKLPFVASQGTFAEVSPSLFWAAWSVPLFLYDIVLSAQRKQ
jgi:uncharacterized membrane protein